jgi:hypothetical protein
LGTNNGTNFTIKPLPLVRLGNDTTICSGNSLTLTATNTSSTYLWSTGATSATISVTNPATYSVTVTNSCGNSTDNIVVLQKTAPVVNLGLDTAICINSAATLNAGNPGSTFLWSTGATTPTINVVTPGNYQVTVTNQCGSNSDTRAITNRPALTVNLGADRGICSGQTISLNAGNAGATYIWNTGSTAQSISITSAGLYSVGVTDVCGTISLW